MARGKEKQLGPYPAHPLGLGLVTQKELAQGLAREKFLQALDEVSGGRLRQGLQELLPVARDYEAAGGLVHWGHLEAAFDPQGKALASQLRGLFESLGLTRERLPNPWPFEVACRTLRQTLEFPDANGKITFDTAQGYWAFDPPPIHPLLPGIVFDPTFMPKITVHDGFEPEVRQATLQEEQARLEGEVSEALEYVGALARLLDVLGGKPKAALVAEGFRLGPEDLWNRWLRSLANVFEDLAGTVPDPERRKSIFEQEAQLRGLPLSAAREVFEHLQREFEEQAKRQHRKLVERVCRQLGYPTPQGLEEEAQDKPGEPPDRNKTEEFLRELREELEGLLSWAPDKLAVRQRVADYIKRVRQQAEAVADRTIGIYPVAYRALAARLLGKPPKRYYGGKEPSFVSKEVGKLCELLPLRLERKRGCPPSRRVPSA
jgi:hypothetical protein